MFRHLRSKIIFSFCVLMIVGGGFSTTLVRRNLSQTLAATVDRSGNDLVRTLASQLEEPLAYGDRLAVRRLLVGVQRANSDVLYAFIVEPPERVVGHSFPVDRFPGDLLAVARSRRPGTYQTETGTVRNLPMPVAGGMLGTLHVGLSTTWIDAATRNAVENVVFTTVLAMAAGIAGILFLANLITRPVLALREAALRLGEGDISARAPVQGQDEIAELATTFNDMARQIRERMEESEDLRAYMQQVLDHMASMILAVSETGEVEYANRAARESHGPLEGRSCSEVLGGERPCDACPVAEVIASGQVLQRRFKAESGRTYDLTYAPMMGRNGRSSVVEHALDVTEKLKLEERFQQAQRLAVAGELSAGIVHAVNNPLDGLRRALELASAKPDDPERLARMLELASEGADRIATVTRTLLGFARLDADPEAILAQPNTLVEGAVKLARLKAQSRGVDIRVEARPDLPLTLMDPQAMKEVLVNLLLNAIDASADGDTVVVSSRRAGASHIELGVEDSGHGISAELADRVFEPFFTTKDADRGTGLGLSVARRVVEAHGGRIVLETPPGGGACFRVLLPIRVQLRPHSAVSSAHA